MLTVLDIIQIVLFVVMMYLVFQAIGCIVCKREWHPRYELRRNREKVLVELEVLTRAGALTQEQAYYQYEHTVGIASLKDSQWIRRLGMAALDFNVEEINRRYGVS